MATFNKTHEQAALCEAAAALKSSGHFNDLTVRCGDWNFHVHKISVSAASEWFKTALTSDFREGSSSEITLVDDDEGAVANMMHFCYHLDYPDDAASPMALHARMFAIGEKYLMPSLQSYAISKIHDAEGPLNIADFAAAVKESYSNTVDPMRLLKTKIVEISITHSTELFGSHDRDAGFRQMVAMLPEYASDVLFQTHESSAVTASASGKRYRCPKVECSGTFSRNGEVVCDTCGGIWTIGSRQWTTKRWESFAI